MNILTKDKWKRFKPDGKLFEKLIHELLGAMYPHTDFSHTSWTHDGGKDFECGFPFLDEEVKVWAECKYHKEPLPIHEVTMTFYMAYIESAFSILFFSYSPVNREFQKYIDLYKKKSNKIIKVFADTSLEELLLKYRNDYNFEFYFGELKIAELPETHDVRYKYWLHTSTKRNGSSIKLYLNDVITLEFSAMNLGSKPLSIELQLHYPKTGNYFQVLDKQFLNANLKECLTVPPYGITGKTIQLKVEKYHSTLKLPHINVKCNDYIKTLRINKPLECQWLAETSIIGQKYELALKDWSDSFNTTQNHLGIIVGCSGTGKSRLLQEINLAAIYEGYQTITFDADKTQSLSALYFFRKLVSEIEDIPYTSNMSHKKITCIYECLKEKTVEYEFVFKILSDDSVNFYKIKNELVSYLLNALNRLDYVMIFDNIQFYDEIILEVLQDITDSLYLSSKSKLIFAANLDYIYKDTVADLLIRKMEWSANTNPKKYFYHKITGFKSEEAKDYLRNCLCYDDKSKNCDNFAYKSAIAEIVKTYGTNPLLLQNYLLYLLQENIIARTDTSAFYIVDCVEFRESITNIPIKLLKLLSFREKALIDYIAKSYTENADIMQQYRLFVTFLAFSKWMPIKMIRKLTKIPDSLIEEMMQIGLLKMNSEGLYGFYHQQIELYFKNCYPYTELSEEALELYIDTALREYNRSLYLETIFLAQYALCKVQSKIFYETVNNILLQKVDYSKSYEICKSVSILLDSKSFEVPQDIYIRLYKNMSNIFINRVGLLKAEELYESIYACFCNSYFSFTDNLIDLMQVLQDYIRALVSLHKVNKSLEKNNYILELVKQYFQNHKDYIPVLIELYYLQIYAYNVLNNLKVALEISDLCIELSKKTEIKKYLIHSWFTKGDTYYTYRTSYHFKSQIIECWNTAWEIYKNTKLEKSSFFVDTAFYLNLLMRNTLVTLFNNNQEASYQNAKELESYFDGTQMMYFEIKIRQLYVIVFLYYSKDNVIEEKDYNRLESLLKKCIDICAVYGNETLYLDCFHLLAILQRSYYRQEFSQDNYKKCFAIAQRILEHQSSLERWSYFLFDLVIAMRENAAECDIPPRIWHLIADNELSERLHELATIKKETFEDYLENEEPISLPYHIEKHIYFPKI